jgi:AraC family transcriptional regulator
MQLTKVEGENIESVFIYITRNFREPFLMSVLCKQYNISAHRLNKGFKNTFDHSPNKYRMYLCMDEARNELSKGTKISDLAYRYGYSSIGSFTRAFKKVYPNAPSWYKFI